jgi:hypothetical protein
MLKPNLCMPIKSSVRAGTFFYLELKKCMVVLSQATANMIYHLIFFIPQKKIKFDFGSCFVYYMYNRYLKILHILTKLSPLAYPSTCFAKPC